MTQANQMVNPIIQSDPVDTLCMAADSLDFICQSMATMEHASTAAARQGAQLLLGCVHQAIEFEVARADSGGTKLQFKLSDFETRLVTMASQMVNRKRKDPVEPTPIK
ncbi:hypothetical protein KO528_00030 [Saccharophagus degradans]|uniref:hypothetical protein n=1 Tax=Saccharophagus degradans TaxID=86304 RepID=UPI001C09ABF2|nr:hypothetical protein [Saccharophagus degradans]MBU2983722.1 hypothetical protein [Saccharophagus degradans]